MIVILALSTTACAHVDEQWIYVNRASLIGINEHKILSEFEKNKLKNKLDYDERDFVVSGHRVGVGDGSIIAMRNYDSGGLLRVDAGGFYKITIYIPVQNIEEGYKINIPNDKGIVAFISWGNSSFPGISGCYGYGDNLNLHVESVSDTSIKFSLHMRMHMLKSPGAIGICKDETIDGTFTAKKIHLNVLTHWQGAPADTIYEETTPP